ncbi:MAG TPA: hypothetical protein VHZ06_03355 [Marmoricola sp.]|nr:hypothetical protein [Marmoricola sp.]
MAEPDRAALRMELVEHLTANLPEESLELFELAAADPQLYFAELLVRHRSGRLPLPAHLVKAVVHDLGHPAT